MTREKGRTAAELGLCEGIIVGPSLPPGKRFVALLTDSREVVPGSLFAALRGVEANGIDFLPDVLARGAAAVLASPEGLIAARATLGEVAVPFLVDENPRRRLAELAARFQGAQPEVAVAVTGTNGKTSVAEFARKLWRRCGHEAASIGTLGAIAPSGSQPLSHTTPDPVRLHGLLAEFAAEGVSHVAFEASSHALAQHRVDAVELAAAVVTGLSREHFDYHGSVEAYGAQKLRLFGSLLPVEGCAVANVDDPFGALALDLARSRGCRTIPVGQKQEASSGIRIRNWAPRSEGQDVAFECSGRRHQVTLPLAGEFQALNALLAAAVLIGCGEEEDGVVAALAALTGVPGRMELVARRENGASVYVDYAHSPGALTAALTAARRHAATGGRVHVIFGAGGSRDIGKRAEMGAVAQRFADQVIVTDDNPRDEDPAEIRRAVREGAPGARDIGNRRQAIIVAVSELAAGDVLVVAGKGHETIQQFADYGVPFDDSAVAREAVEAVAGG